MMLAHQRHEPRAVLRRVAARDQLLDRRRDARGDLLERQAEIGRAHHLALAHRNAAGHLRQEFAEPDAHEQLFQLAEAAGLAHALRVGGKLADRLDIGRKPRQPVRGALLAVEQIAGNAAVLAHPLADRPGRIREQRFDGGDRVARVRDQVGSGFGIVAASAMSNLRSGQ